MAQCSLQLCLCLFCKQTRRFICSSTWWGSIRGVLIYRRRRSRVCDHYTRQGCLMENKETILQWIFINNHIQFNIDAYTTELIVNIRDVDSIYTFDLTGMIECGMHPYYFMQTVCWIWHSGELSKGWWQ